MRLRLRKCRHATQASFDRERYQSSSRTAAGPLLFFSACLRRVARALFLFFSRSHHAVIRVYDEAGNVRETHEHAGELTGP